MDIPKIIKAPQKDLDRVKGVLKLGFASDVLIRWVFPDAASFLKCFDIWMEEFSKIAFENILFTQKRICMDRLFGIRLELILIILF